MEEMGLLITNGKSETVVCTSLQKPVSTTTEPIELSTLVGGDVYVCI